MPVYRTTPGSPTNHLFIGWMVTFFLQFLTGKGLSVYHHPKGTTIFYHGGMVASTFHGELSCETATRPKATNGTAEVTKRRRSCKGLGFGTSPEGCLWITERSITWIEVKM